MSRVEAAAATDRLPWLADEPKPTQAKRRSAFAPWAAGIVLAVAGSRLLAGREKRTAAHSGAGHSLRSGDDCSVARGSARSSPMFASFRSPKCRLPQRRRSAERRNRKSGSPRRRPSANPRT